MSIFDLLKKKKQNDTYQPQRPAPGQVGYVIPSGKKEEKPVFAANPDDPHYYGIYANGEGGYEWFDPRASRERQMGGYSYYDTSLVKENFAALYRSMLPEYTFQTNASPDAVFAVDELRSWLTPIDFLFTNADGAPLLAVLLADKNHLRSGMFRSLKRKGIPVIRFFVDMVNYESYVVGRTYDELKKHS
ncbi:MAG: hypothetical protein IJ744_06245 [Lachnospiraceae bacterium]|nr:hypothetical protein [Lachnospiraceae bacterium]